MLEELNRQLMFLVGLTIYRAITRLSQTLKTFLEIFCDLVDGVTKFREIFWEEMDSVLNSVLQKIFDSMVARSTIQFHYIVDHISTSWKQVSATHSPVPAKLIFTEDSALPQNVQLDLSIIHCEPITLFTLHT
ncbi:hypothetical protein T10_9221 [Trichinella papuae]|uniref:Uncharacterized protein n=1 Tax=Trichinella papuae TaxID=268474 RepID=A0A0V1MRL3_9BILA|nr:hypothetical protein T10_9221 [Trichinella papuae]